MLNNTPYSRLRALNEWGKTSERREVNVRKDDLAWAVSMLALLSDLLDGDLEDMDTLDLNEELSAPPADLSKEEEPL